MWEKNKRPNVFILGTPEGEEKEGKTKSIKKMVENVPNMAKDIQFQLQEVETL